MNKKHHVVVVGGGFGGLACVQGLRHENVEITLVDNNNHHLFQPLLYQVATSILPAAEIAWPLRHLLRDRPEVETLMAEVVDVDSAAQMIEFSDGGTLDYDTLVLATGARHSYFGHDDWETAAPGLKTLDDATAIRRSMLSAFEAAERSHDPVERAAFLTFAVVGAGPTGVELVGIIADLAQRVLPREFRNIDTRDARVMLIEAGPRVLPAFSQPLSDYACRALTELGVEVMCGTAVTACDDDMLTVGGQNIPVRTTIWAAGVKASRAAQWLGLRPDPAGRTPVELDLTVRGHPEIFVIGDTAKVINSNGKYVPGIAPAAKQQGEYVARQMLRRLNGITAEGPFHYRHRGSLATIGRKAAVADFGRIKLTGAFAWWVWGIAHIYFLIGTRNRVAVVWSWLWAHFTGQSSARLITPDKQGIAVAKVTRTE